MSAADAGPTDIVFATVRRCRRRMQLVSAARRAALTIPAAIVAVEIAALVLRLAPAQLVLMAAATVATAVVAAVLPSIVQAPTMAATAAAIDARLRLQDRIVTALQLVDDRDPMAQLVVRDAAVRLSNVAPLGAFPLEAPAQFRATVLATVAVTVLFLVFAVSPARWMSAGLGSNGASGAGGGRASRPATPGSHAQVVEGAAPSSPEGRQRPSKPDQPNRQDTPVGRESVRNDTDTRASARGANEARPLATRASTPGRDAGSAVGAADAGRGATGFAERTATAAGGVNGALTSNPPRTGQKAALAAAPGTAAYREEYRAASARAQSAIAQERVPARLRAYVKRYFVAIRP